VHELRHAERLGAVRAASEKLAELPRNKHRDVLERSDLVDSCIPAAATFSSRCSTETVRGIGSITSERCSSHASAI
jgi:hypothetical protein